VVDHGNPWGNLLCIRLMFLTHSVASITLTGGHSRTDHILTTYDLDLQSPASYVHGLHAKVKG